MVLLGIIISKLYLPFIKDNSGLGRIVFSHTLGFTIGSVLAIIIIKFLGANSLFLIILSFFSVFLFKGKKMMILPLLVGLCLVLFPIDSSLESFRDQEVSFWPNTLDPIKEFSGWSPYSKIDIYSYNEDCIAGVYNYVQQWFTCHDGSKDFEFRKKLYSNFQGDILVIGTGGGVGLRSLDKTNNITAVEIDPLVVALMENEFSYYNGDTYNLVDVYAMDGRSFLDSKDNYGYDYVIYEGIDYTYASRSKVFIEVENYLFTEEGILSALNTLSESGTLIILSSPNLLALSKTIKAIPVEYKFDLREGNLYDPLKMSIFVLTITKDDQSLQELTSFYLSNEYFFEEFSYELEEVEKIVDDKPFLYNNDNGKNILKISYIIFALILILILTRKNKFSEFYFFFLGIAMILVELFYITKLRSLFGDYVLTFVIFSLIFFIGFSLGNYYYKKLNRYKRLTPIILLFSFFMLYGIPWSYGFIFKLVFIIISIFPVGIFLGIYFPLGLSKISERDLYISYMLDSVGIAIGFFLFYVISMAFGTNIVFFISILTYVFLISIFKNI